MYRRYSSKILVRSQILGKERFYTHQWHTPNAHGLKNVLRMAEWVANHTYRDYPYKDEVYVWLEFEGNILDIEKAKMAVAQQGVEL